MMRSLEALFDQFQVDTSRTWANPCPDYLAIAGMGLAGEAAEVTAIVVEGFDWDLSPERVHHLQLELGDLLHYAAALARCLGTTLGRFVAPREGALPLGVLMRGGLGRVMLDLNIHAGQAADAAKKMRFHGHPAGLNPALDLNMHRVVLIVLLVAGLRGLSIEGILAANLAKQRARYPDGFSTEASMARADEQGC